MINDKFLLFILNCGLASDCIGVFKAIILKQPTGIFTNILLFSMGLYVINLIKKRV